MPLSPGVFSPARTPDPVKVYQDKNFKGTNASFSQEGDYVIGTSTTGVPDDSISSIQVQPGWSAELFETSTFGGAHGLYDYIQDNITNTLEDKVSAIRIRRTPAPTPRAPAPAPKAPAPAPDPRPSPAPAPVSVPPGTRTTTLPARFRIKTLTGDYLTNKLRSSTAGAPTLSLDQTAPVVNFSIVTSGLYSLPANYVALKDADVSASNSGHYNSGSSSYVSRGTFWSSAQGGGPGWAWQFYRQSDGTFIIVNDKNGVNNYFFKLSSSDLPQVTTNLSSATKFTIEDASTPISREPAPAPKAPAPAPLAFAPSPMVAMTPTPKAPAPAPLAFAPSPMVAMTPTPKAPAPTPKAPAPTPKAPAPTPKAPAPTPKTPAPTPKAPAPTPKAPAPTPKAPAPTPLAPAPTPKAPAPSPSEEEGISWWVWLIVAIVILLLIGAGYYYYSTHKGSKLAAPSPALSQLSI